MGAIRLASLSVGDKRWLIRDKSGREAGFPAFFHVSNCKDCDFLSFTIDTHGCMWYNIVTRLRERKEQNNEQEI